MTIQDFSIAHVMIDIETAGITPGSQIFSIGAVVFYGVNRIQQPIEWIVSSESSLQAGFTQDSKTMHWWANQPAQARKLLFDTEGASAYPLAEALAGLARVTSGGRHLWCKGVGFDFPILAEAYRRCGWGKAPWHYRQERCYRTLAALRPDIEAGENPNPHSAAGDALHQARHASKVLEAIGGTWDRPA